MLVKDVVKLSPLDRFWYFIRERHAIYLRRKMGQPKPWTDDEVLQSYFFTNPYRENDKVTVWFRENIREPLRDRPEVIFATIAFRWFNLPSTGQRLIDCLDGYRFGRLERWDPKHVLTVLDAERKKGRQIFTGAFMINSPPGQPKLEAIIERVTNVWEDREALVDFFFPVQGRTLQAAHERLQTYPGLGGFMAYEVVTDLRHTYLLENATDIMTWCNPGPGCIRGLYRVFDMPFEKGNNSSSPPKPKDWLGMMGKLLAKAPVKLRGMPPVEMREIEHSLCELDKYCRALEGDGKLKRRYDGA